MCDRMNRFWIASIIIFVFLVSPQPLFAVGSSGFENASYSARSLGQSNAVVARPEEPSTTAFNPAGLPDLRGVQTDINTELLDSHTWFKSSVTKDWESSRNPLAIVPTGFVTANLGERFDNRVGLGAGLTFPFGLNNRYETGSRMASLVGSKNSVKIAALTIATGIKLHEKLSIGGGAVNYRIMQYDQTFNYPNSFILKNSTYPDGLINTYQHGNAWGWVASALAKPIDHHQVGVFYRSRANVRTHGRAKVTGLIYGALQGYDTEPYFETGIHSDVQLPSNVTVGYAYIPSKKWAAEVDFGWTGWSTFADQNITFDRNNATTQALGQIPRNFHNTLSFNVGGHYLVTKKFDLLGGAYYYTPASPKDTFDVVIPDSNRYAATGGFTYKITKRLDFSTTLLALLFGTRNIANPGLEKKLGVNIDGKYTSFVYGLMSGFTYRFGKIEDEPEETPAVTANPIIREFPKTT